MADATGWSVDYILNKINYQTLIMMLSDAPRYRSASKRKFASDVGALTAEEEASAVSAFFASNLKQ